MKNDTNMSQIKQYAIDTFNAEADAIRNLSNLLTDDFDQAVEAILVCTGEVVVTGMGKSGIIGKKIAATLASTGTPAFFLHPGEAYHGDLGMISNNDVVLAIANSGQTDEVLKLIPFMQNNGNTIIAITGNPQSTLAKNAHFHLNINVGREACPLNLAPTSSTTAMLVMGDALAIALMKMRNFKAEDYAVFHPGGSLGRRLLTRVRDVIRKDGVPCVPKTMTLGEILAKEIHETPGKTLAEDDRGAAARPLPGPRQGPCRGRLRAVASPTPAKTPPPSPCSCQLNQLGRHLRGDEQPLH